MGRTLSRLVYSEEPVIDAVGRGSPAAAPGPAVYLGRQPIYNAQRAIVAYELLHRRSGYDATANVVDADQATAQTVLKAFLEIGVSRISPEQPVFINHTEPLLKLDPIIPADRCVIEVLENVPVNPGTIAALERLKKLGYRIALDNFTFSQTMFPFLAQADYVKLDVRALSVSEFRRHVALLKRSDVRIVAEKIESDEEFQACRDLGCDLFQGYYLRKPEVVTGTRIPNNRLSVLSLLTECMKDDACSRSIAAIMDRDAVLSYGLLQLANSALFGRRQELRSPSEAVLLLGVDCVFRWAVLLVMAGYDDCPIGYLEFALQRAHMTEQLAEAYHCPRYEAYVLGLLSTLDSILNAPLAEVIEPLPLHDALKEALIHHEGALGVMLDDVVAYESGQLEIASRRIDPGTLQKAFWTAADSSRRMLNRLEKSHSVLMA
jgi:EAL and modified HD-GYP domain-containing signal transduction protein